MSGSGADELDAIAAELYAVPPAGFTAARTARAREADGELATRIGGLPKPVVSAWAVDLLAREGRLTDALALAAALREAQDDLDAAELSKLSRQRRQLAGALAAEAVDLAEAHGVSVSTAARDDVEKTLTAAMMDAAAAAAVLSARLVKPLEAAGWGEVDLAGRLGGSMPGAAPEAPSDDLAERRARKAAEKAAREAERAAESAEREHTGLEVRRGRAQEHVDRLAVRLDELRRELDRVERDEAAARAELDDLAQAVTAAADAARTAAKKAEAARRGLG
ncbi:transposase [Microbacterium sp. W1N]|uniref:transposase n=1 Tax=Microbacterium festucae TaxID=2977531 RepID=UPI0021C14093|nr:transposase [Microbacterium festucae]MCT9819573.1 transposase [Microbacterium festucae]